MFKSLRDLLVSQDYSDHTAICYDDGERKVYVTYSDLLRSSLELAGSLRKCVGDNKVFVCFVPGGRANDSRDCIKDRSSVFASTVVSYPFKAFIA